MELETMIQLLTMLVTIFMGILAKRNDYISNHLIPLQNIIIGVFVAVGTWIITKDFSIAIATSGIMAGGVYDIVHNLQKLMEE